VGTLKSQLITFNLGRAIANPQSSDNIQILPGDTITVTNQKDVLVPSEKQMRVVRIQGEVNAPGIYQVNGSETLRDLIKKAGGFTSAAYLFGTEVTRQSIKFTQKKNLEGVIKRLEDQLYQTNINISDQVSSVLRVQNQARLRERITLLTNSKPLGRLALELDPKRPQLPDIALESGDEITVPFVPSIVSVVGAVYNENALIYKPGKTVKEYIRSSGLSPSADIDSIFLLRADGTLLTQDANNYFISNKLDKVTLNPGDTIIVPEKMLSESAYSIFIRGMKDWTQVVFQLGLGAAAIKVLR